MVGPDKKELPKDDQGRYIGTGTPKIDVTETESTENPVMDEAGNPVEAGAVDALLLKVKAHFAEEEDTEILSVTVLETKPVREVAAAEFAKL